jgi:3-dehydroquinate dehydratase-2
MSSPRIMLLNGPNLNLLGEREPEVYGQITWLELEEKLRRRAGELGYEVVFRQSNHEGLLIDWIQEARDGYAGLIINPGALTHYSYALQDALRSLSIPVVEVHLSNIYSREEFRSKSVVSPVARGVISGFGPHSYLLALEALHLEQGA